MTTVNLELRQNYKHLEMAKMLEARDFLDSGIAMEKQIKQLWEDKVVLQKEVKDQLSQMAKTEAGILARNFSGITMTGQLEGWPLQIRGVVKRRGKGPDGPCWFCERMLKLKTLDKMVAADVNCRWAGQDKPGHIQSFPEGLELTAATW